MTLSADNFQLLGPSEEDDSRLLVRNDDRMFFVSRAAWDVFIGMSKGLTDAQLSDALSGRLSGKVPNKDQLSMIKSHVISQLQLGDNPKKTAAIWGKIYLLGQDRLEYLVKKLHLLPLDMRLFAPLFAVLVVLNISVFLFLMRNSALEVSIPSQQNVLQQSTIVLFAMFLIMLLHEIGHATAVMRFGLRPPRIGAGFLLVFPTLFTDVSEIWRLHSRKRVLVNLAGIYVQLCVSILAATVIGLGPQALQDVTKIIYFANMSIIFVNILPFAKLDGYWTLSDLLGEDDLQKKSFSTLKQYLGLLLLRKNINFDRKQVPLLLFGTLNLMFYFTMFAYAGMSVLYFGKAIIDSANPIRFGGHLVASHLVGSLCIILLIFKVTNFAVNILRSRNIGQ